MGKNGRSKPSTSSSYTALPQNESSDNLNLPRQSNYHTTTINEPDSTGRGGHQQGSSCECAVQSILDGEGRLEGWSTSILKTVLWFALNMLTLAIPYFVLNGFCKRPSVMLRLTANPAPLAGANRLLVVSNAMENVESVVNVERSRSTTGGMGVISESNMAPFLFSPTPSSKTLLQQTSTASLIVHQGSKTNLLDDDDPLNSSRTSSQHSYQQHHEQRYFMHRLQKWVWCRTTALITDSNDVGCDAGPCGLCGGGANGRFVRLQGLVGPHMSTRQLLNHFSTYEGISNREALLTLHGPNVMDVKVKGWIRLLLEEAMNPFYIFQVFSIILWCLDDYVYYASCVVIISTISIGISVVETRRQAKMLRNMATNSERDYVTVRTPTGGDTDVRCGDLVPGDVLVIPAEGCILPCDAVLRRGTCLVNESMLTGESTPVQKSALVVGGDDIWDDERYKRHTLFGGTQVLQTRYYPGESVTAVVVRTGFNTAKGELIHSILFPKPLGFGFYSDAMKFVGILFALASLGMIYTSYVYLQRGTSWGVTLLRVLDIVTIVVPPALPAAMTVGMVYAQGRLKEVSIFCTSPPRINFCGKLKLICFDKTGTLTEEGLDLASVVPVSSLVTSSSSPTPSFLLSLSMDLVNGEHPHPMDKTPIGTSATQFLKPVSRPSLLPPDSPLLHALASCHSLTYIHNRLVGDPLDLKMFASTEWELEEPSGASGTKETSKFDLLTPTVVKRGGMELGILRELEFTPQLQRMSVIVRNLAIEEGAGKFDLYSKGAPEQIRALCLPSSIPKNFDEILDSFTVGGFRVLGLATRPLTSMKWHQLHRAKRETLEKDLCFVGFLVMQNSLKPATRGVIQELNAASIRSVMVTGDNSLTALSVARECGIVGTRDKVVILGLDDNNRLSFKQASAADSNHNQQDNQISAAETVCSVEFDEDSFNGVSLSGSDVVFVMSGTTFSYLWETEERCEERRGLLDRIVAKGAVYARMSPENKAQLIRRLQGIGYVVGMCGDGANDCSALKAAHVGISLSEAEASVAAPFTSKVADISCVPQLIREGRCALVTSFSTFKYMALYSLVQFASVLILYTHNTNLADTQFLWVDLGITTSIAIVMGSTRPYPRLVRAMPSASLISVVNIVSIILQVLLATAIQIGAIKLLQSESWFVAVSPSSADELDDLCWETTSIFCVSSFQYLILALVLSKGPPFRKPFYTNRWFVVALMILSGTTLLMSTFPPVWMASFFYLMPVTQKSTPFRLLLLTLPAANLLLALVLEGAFVERCLKRLKRRLVKKKNGFNSSPSDKKKTDSRRRGRTGDYYKNVPLGELESDPLCPPVTLI